MRLRFLAEPDTVRRERDGPSCQGTPENARRWRGAVEIRGKLHDISLPLGKDTLVWPGDPPIEVTPKLRLAQGDSANVSELRIGTHSGTHVDPPVHFIQGAPSIDRLSLDRVVGPAFVADLREANGPIGPPELEALGLGGDVTRLLLRTSDS